MDVKDLLKAMTKEHVIAVMERVYNASYVYGKDGIIIFESVCHNSDSKKLYYYHEPRTNQADDIGRHFYCFVCGCKGNIIDILEELSGFEFSKSISIIEEVTGIKLQRGSRKVRGLQLGGRENTDLSFLSIHTRKKNEYKTVNKTYDSSILDCFSLEYPLDWQKEGIDGYTAEKFDFRFNHNTNQAIIPVRDLQGDLVGIRVRNFDEKAVERGYKYMPLSFRGEMYRFPTSSVLYGVYENQAEIRKSGKVFLFEGEKSTAMVDSFYCGHNLALAVYGSNLSTHHRDLLLKLGVKEVTLCFDKEYCEEWYDDEYKGTKEQILMFNYFKKLKKICKMLSSYFVINIVIDWENDLELKDSPVDKGRSTFEKLLASKVTINDVEEDFKNYFGI